MAAVLEELRKMTEREVPEEELAKAREFTKGRLRLGLESTNATASWLSQQLLLTGSVRTVEEVVKLIDSLTATDLRRVAGRVLDAPVQLAVIGPFASDKGFRALVGA